MKPFVPHVANLSRTSALALTLAKTTTTSSTSLGFRHGINTFSNMASATNFFAFTPKDKRSQDYPLSQHRGKVVLVVNTASKCGFTPQFKGLEQVYKDLSAKYPDKFTVIGFPCNQFGHQDPGSNDEIQEFCQLNYGVSFPVLGKIDVNGDNADPLYEWMKNEKKGVVGLRRIKWNFEKFLISKDGQVVKRYASLTKPESIVPEIVAEIENGGNDNKGNL